MVELRKRLRKINYGEEIVIHEEDEKPSKFEEEKPDLGVKKQKRGKLSLKEIDVKIDVLKKSLGMLIDDGSLQYKKSAVHFAAGTSNCKFSRMSGIQEFKNCICLFVNVNDDTDYDNKFVQKGEKIQMTWFAQNSQTGDSKVIQRIINLECPLLLFLRHPGNAYVYFGIISYEAGNLDVRPMEFIYVLESVPKLIKDENMYTKALLPNFFKNTKPALLDQSTFLYIGGNNHYP